MYFRVGTNIRKCMVWSQSTKPETRWVWRIEFCVSVELRSLLLNFIVLDVEFCKTKNVIKNDKIYS